MTNKEKVKAYDEALEKAKEILEMTSDKSAIYTIFPELKESEDEKIRNGLVRLLKELLELGGVAEDEWDRNECEKYIAWLEKQDEQKLTDKVKPKFKVGDWLIFNERHNGIYQVERIDDYRYYLRHYLGGTLSVHFDNELIRLWTIQDAKDGDVLDANGAPFIYKKHDKDYVYFYCGVNLADTFIEANGIDTWNNNNNKVYPATKEQRDTLLKAMADAGYTFDFENKELKRIKQKPAWNESDDRLLRVCVAAINGIDNFCPENKQELTDWLKSLENRIIPQSKQKWSEEDEKIYQSIIDDTVQENQLDNRQINWIKSIRLQNRWKPSEAQMDSITCAVRKMKESACYDSELISLFNDLKKLKDK